MGGRGDVGIVQHEAISKRNASRLRCKFRSVEGAEQIVAGPVAGEHAAGAICTVRRGSQPKDEEARLGIAKGRNRLAPIIPIAISTALLPRYAGTIDSQPLAFLACDDFILKNFE